MAEQPFTPDDITLALLGQKMDTLTEESRQSRLEISQRMTQQDERMLRFELRMNEFGTSMATSTEDRKGIWRELNSLKTRVMAWDLVNSLAGAILAIFVTRK